MSITTGEPIKFATLKERNAWIARQATEGQRTLSSIAEEVGLTRERVRQIVAAQTGDDHYRTRMIGIKKEKRARDVRLSQLRRQLINKFSPTYRAPGFGSAKKYSDEELLQYLRDFALDYPELVPFGPYIWTEKAVYPEERGGSGLRPTAATYLKRWATFSDALEAAGLPTYIPRGHMSHRRPDEQILDDLISFFNDPRERAGSAGAYDAWSRTRDAASLSLVRQRFGSWRTAKAEALDAMGIHTSADVQAKVDALMATLEDDPTEGEDA